jgi:hypothetical protein
MSPRLTLEPRLGNVPEANRVNAAVSDIVSAIVRNRVCGALAVLTLRSLRVVPTQGMLGLKLYYQRETAVSKDKTKVPLLKCLALFKLYRLTN